MQFSKLFAYYFAFLNIINCLIFSRNRVEQKKKLIGLLKLALLGCCSCWSTSDLKVQNCSYLRRFIQSQSNTSHPKTNNSNGTLTPLNRFYLLFHYTEYPGKAFHFNKYKIMRIIASCYLCRMFSTSEERFLYRMLVNSGIMETICYGRRLASTASRIALAT